jgi:hypothetical protein
MATLATVVLAPLGKLTTGTTAGQAGGYQAANIGGDLVPLTGQGTIVRLKTTGTACTWTLDNVLLSSYGGDQDLTITLAATDEQEIFIRNDGRFDQGSGNAGFAKLTPSTITGAPQIAAKIVP